MRTRIPTLLLLVLGIGAQAQQLTEVTATYLKNPSFEEDDITTLAADATRGAYKATAIVGWTLSGSYGVSDIMTASASATDNDFGAPGNPSDGTQMYYIRNAWSASSAALQQSVTLPAGTYKITVDNKCVTTSSHSARLVAGSEQAGLTFLSTLPAAWNTTELTFTVAEETSVNLGLSVSFGGGSGGSILIDNFRLYQYEEGYTEPEDPTEERVASPTEGTLTADFVDEATMMADLLQMVANFSKYMTDDFYDCAYPNSINEACGYFNGESSGQANEAGVRTNADLGMLCAFLVKYGQPAGVALPDGVTWERIQEMAMKSLVFAYSTHKANRLKVCAGSTNYWGSTGTSDYVWESSLWAMSVAYSAFFQWDSLTDTQKTYIYNLLKAECNYELQRSIPTGYSGDTKAEENGWEADILAATLGLFPNDPLAEDWFARLRQFAVNSYSHYRDASDTQIIDPEYDGTTVADLYIGNNLYGDYTLQNHNLFHTSYQNVVMQELGEAALALQLFQGNNAKWKTNALMHNNQEVMDSVLNWLALTDGELAMPNGNDWSLFLYDQITSYTTQACFQNDAHALMLENLAYKYIKARQSTTNDGSWLLRPDVSARRMGVEGHRVMMTYLMHLVASTSALTPTDWETFRAQHSEAKLLPYQNIVRAFTKDRFTTFSWSTGLKSYTGYFAANSVDCNKIVVPYRANNTGNLMGWYTVSGKSTNASPVVSGIYELKGDAYTMNGELATNDAALNHRFALYSTPGNAFIYIDDVKANNAVTITGEYGGLLAISTDELTKLSRTLYYSKGDSITHRQTDGNAMSNLSTDWINIDNQLGVVGRNGKSMAFGDRGANNSIYTSKLYPMYASDNRNIAQGGTVDRRNLVYYSNISAEATQQASEHLQPLTEQLPDGWNGVLAADPDNTYYLLLANFRNDSREAQLNDIATELGAPVFETLTTINAEGKSTATFSLAANHSTGQELRIFLSGMAVSAQQADAHGAYVTAKEKGTLKIHFVEEGETLSGEVNLQAGETMLITAQEGKIVTETAEQPETTRNPNSLLVNPNFDEGTEGWKGSPTINYSCGEKYNTTFNVYQQVSGLQPGRYEVFCQGFYRDGGYDAAAQLRDKGTEALNARLYATGSVESVDTALVSIFSEAGKVGTVGVKQSTYGYIPNSMEQASFYLNAGLYPNRLQVTVGDDGILTVGVKKTVAVSSDWTLFDSFSLTYLGTTDGIDAPKTTSRHPFGKSGAYTPGGVRVAEPSRHPGIYIVDGKTVLYRSGK